MHGRIRILEGPYLRDLLSQPAAVRDTARALAAPEIETRIRKLIPNKPDRFLLTGMGSSLHAFHPLCARLNQAGHPASMVESGELTRYHPSSLRDSAMVATSQSGRSAEIVRLVKRRRDSSFLIGVTNSLDSPLARRADAVVPMDAGKESTVSCKTYVATLTALAWLGDILCGPGKPRTPAAFEKASQEMEAYLANWKDHVESLARILKGVKNLFYAGRGASLGAVSTGALITKEAAHFHAEGMSAPQFRHGPFEMLNGNVLVLVFPGGAETRKLNLRLAEDIRKAGGRSEVVGEEASEAVFRLPRATDAVRPLFEILPIQMITLALAAMNRREAGHFELASKITDVE